MRPLPSSSHHPSLPTSQPVPYRPSLLGGGASQGSTEFPGLRQLQGQSPSHRTPSGLAALDGPQNSGECALRTGRGEIKGLRSLRSFLPQGHCPTQVRQCALGGGIMRDNTCFSCRLMHVSVRPCQRSSVATRLHSTSVRGDPCGSWQRWKVKGLHQ